MEVDFANGSIINHSLDNAWISSMVIFIYIISDRLLAMVCGAFTVMQFVRMRKHERRIEKRN
jgi:hypothetical protein